MGNGSLNVSVIFSFREPSRRHILFNFKFLIQEFTVTEVLRYFIERC